MTAPACGFVSLVGAGPGHPDHLTQKAASRLRAADLVLHDALVSPEVLALARHAEVVCVGKRGGGEQTSQATIEHLLVAAGLAGRRVVRLKGGDPFVFGRGGEEALALQAAGIPFEVVPGLTTAIAAPALAGIPVTHRGTSSGFVVITASDESAFDATIAALPPGLLTLVAMMSVRARAGLTQRLIDRGWPAGTPAALVLGAATPHMWVWKGGLAQLATVAVPAPNGDAPGTIVVGAVAGLPIDLFEGFVTADARAGAHS
ncbi:MAG: uroporphyrinogen-III C-methyltransferase [Acidobacteriota bacterium]|nr:uroporphyrinogen-III C-methyltransferase [Acidobacteriota bacterium]